MKEFLVKNKYLLLILILAGFLRFWQLSSVPPSLYWDEVSQGYNAYSILKTGKDEHGELFPIARFKAFGDYKAPVYIYLIVPFMTILGKSDLAIRMPSALFGTLSVLLAYGIVYELFFRSKNRNTIALFTSLFLAVSPWHIQLSRAAYEGNIATFFTMLGVWLFLCAVRKKPILIIVSIVSFVLAFYSFNAHRVFIPLFVLFLFALYFKDLLKEKKVILISVFVGVIMLVPFFLYFKSPESRLRFNEVNIFTDLDTVITSNRYIEDDNSSAIAKILHNRRVLFAQEYVKNYFDFFNPVYLFITGDENPRFSLQDNGELFLWMLPLLLIGGYFLIIKKSRESVFIAGWFLLAPIAAATARETPHALRSETFIPTYELIAGYGAAMIFYIYHNRTRSYMVLQLTLGTAVVVSLIFFIHNYFVHFPTIFGGTWQYGYKEAVKETEKLKGEYDVISFTHSYGRPYIYVLFYGDYKPSDYPNIANVDRDIYGFYTVKGLGKYQFEDNHKLYPDKKVLYVLDPNEYNDTYTVIKTTKFLDGTPAFIFATKK